jgi:glycerol-3-phosphate acyltransferase PlsY
MGVFRVASIASLGSILAGMLLYIVQALNHNRASAVIFPLVVTTGIIIWTHRDNIKRLRSGNENKV